MNGDVRGSGPVVVPGTPHGEELRKFEQFPGPLGPAGNPYTYRPFPRMLYKAQRYKGHVVCGAVIGRPTDYASPQEYGAALMDAENFTKTCQRIVGDEVEKSRAFEDGWRESPEAAIAFFHERDQKLSTEAAMRAYDDRNMSEAAKAEGAEFEAQSEGHTPEIPEKRKRGRSRKDAA